MNKDSKTDWKRLSEMGDEDIDRGCSEFCVNERKANALRLLATDSESEQVTSRIRGFSVA